MPIELDHAIVPARDRRAAARLLGEILGVASSESGVGPFSPVCVNASRTLDVDQLDGELPVLHDCFRMSDREFDALLERLQRLGIGYRNMPHGPLDMHVNARHGGRIVYWREPDGHVWEALTVSYPKPPRGG